ncbi:MAG: methyltransferase domain-containing protein [Pseudomonadota bacterium]
MTTPECEDDVLAQAYNLGLSLEKAGDLDGAAAAYRQALALDPSDHGGVSVRLAAIGRGPVPAAAPEAYVATLFDQNAAAFDDMLVEQLGYAVPMLLRERFAALGLGPFGRLLDLGCGTGLTGSSLADLVTQATGVDLSEQMLEEAHERDCYDALFVAEAVAFLQEAGPDEGAPWELIAATDVLPYIGDLDAFFAGAAAKLTSGGLLAVSAETLPSDQMCEKNFTVTAKHRFAHSAAYLDALVERYGFNALERLPIDVRYDEGEPISGYLLLAQLDA